MFYAVDLSKPRKFIQERYKNIILGYRLKTQKINKSLAGILIIGFIIVAGTTVNAAGTLDQVQYNYLLSHYINDLQYPKELATKLLNSLTVTDLQELYTRVQSHDVFMNKYGNTFLDIMNNVTFKAMNAVKYFMKL